MENSQPLPSAFLSAGVLTLDTAAHILSGPAGTRELHGRTYVLLRTLMRQPGQAAPMAQIVEAFWPDPDLQPRKLADAVKGRVLQARHAIAAVGAPRNLLRVVYRGGYLIEGAPRVVRALTPAQAVALDQLLATHPNAALVAAFATQAPGAPL